MAAPPTSITPLSGASIAPSRCSSVDLPDPLGPVSAAVSPAARSRLASSTAGMSSAFPGREGLFTPSRGRANPGQVAGGPSRGPQQRVLARAVPGRRVVNVSRQRKPQDRARPGGGVVGAVDLHDDGLAEQGPGGGAVEGQGQRGQQGEAGDGKGDPDGGQQRP